MPAPDFATAREYYEAAEAEAQGGHYDEALRDYEQAYAITKDPVLFWKLAATQERAGHCDRAIPLYRRYLDEAHPAPDFAAKAEAHIAGCSPKPATATPPPLPPPAATPPPAPAPTPKLDLHMAPSRRAAWLLTGASGGLVVVGAILAYAASSSENDVRDLYVPTGTQPPQYAGATKTRYAQLVAEGQRYEHESWAAFGLAGGAAIGAAIFFYVGAGEARVTPVVTPSGAGVRVKF